VSQFAPAGAGPGMPMREPVRLAGGAEGVSARPGRSRPTGWVDPACGEFRTAELLMYTDEQLLGGHPNEYS